MSRIELKFNNIYLHETIESNQNHISKNIIDIDNYKVSGFEYLSYQDVIQGYGKLHINKILNMAQNNYENDIEAMVVLAPGSLCIQLQNAIDFIYPYPIKDFEKIETIFISDYDDLNKIKSIFNKLFDKKFIILNYLFDQNEKQTEIFNNFYKLLIQNEGEYNAKKYVYYGVKTSDKNNFFYSKYKGFNTIVIGDKFKKDYAFFAMPSLFILAINKIDIKALIESAVLTDLEFSEPDINFNELLKYASVLYKYKDSLFIFSTMESVSSPIAKLFKYFYFKILKKLTETQKYPSSFYSSSIDFQKNNRKIFEHFLSIKTNNYDYDIYDDINNEDGLGNLTATSMNAIEVRAKKTAIEIRGKYGQSPIVEMILQDNSERTLADIIIFIQKITLLMCYLEDKNPFEQ